MHLDVLDLRAFYYRTKLGRTTQRALQDALRALWPDTRAMTVVGFGFAAPVLRPFLADARRVVVLMPAQQGAMHWPVGGPNVSALVEETRWPIETGAVDRLIVAHGLETCERPDALLDEIGRVLAPQGQVVFIVPNRSGLWARREGTPFGFGRPYTFGQVEAILDRHGLVAGRHAAALYAPPSHRRFWLQTAHLWERLGRRFDPHLVAGALLVEATKQVFARPRPGARASILGPLEALEGLARPSPEPTTGRTPVMARLTRAQAEKDGPEPAQSEGSRPYCHVAIPLLSPRRLHRGVTVRRRSRVEGAPGFEGLHGTEGWSWPVLNP